MNDSTKRRADQTRKLRAMILARAAFEEAFLAARFLASPESPKGDSVRRVMLAGIVVSYMRPFLASNGIPSLPKQYSEDFAGSRMLAQAHEAMKVARHSLFAHHDEEKSAILVSKNLKSEIPGIEIEVGTAANGFPIFVRRAELNEVGLNQSIELFEFQLGRVQAEVDTKIEEEKRHGSFPPGRYILGEGFP